MNGCDGVAASDNGSSAGAGGGCDGLGDLERAFRERGHFEYAHGTVPDNGFYNGNFLTIGFDGFGTDVQAHPAVGCGGDGNGLRRGVRFEFRADDVIHGKQQCEFLLLGFFTQTPREVQFVVFDQRLADGLAVGIEEGVRHAAANEHGVGNFHQVFDDFDFVADFGPTENRDEGTRGIRHGFAEVGQLFFHEQPRRRLPDEARDADNGSMRAVSGAEGVANEDAVAQGGELLRKGFVIFFFVGMEADVFQHEHFPVAQGLALAFGAWTDTIQSEGDWLAEQLFQFFGGGPEGIFWIRAAFGPAEMRSKHEAGALFNGEPQCRQSFADACVVGDDAVFQGNVEIHADENAFAAEVEVVDGELGHELVTRDSCETSGQGLACPTLELRRQEFDQVAATAGVAPLIVVPGQDLDAAVTDDFGVLGIHDGGIRIALEVGGDELFFGVSKNTFHWSAGGSFQGGVDGFFCGGLVDENGQVHDADVGRGHAHGVAVEFALQFGNDEVQSLRSARRAGNHVDGGGAGAAQILVREVEELLVVGVGMNGGHGAAMDSKRFVEDFGDGCETVCGAGSVRNDVMLRRIVSLVVHAEDEGGVRAVGRRGDNDFFHRRAKMLLRVGALGKKTGGFDDDVRADRGPVNFGRIFRLENLEALPFHGDGVFGVRDGVRQVAEDGVVLQKVCERLGIGDVIDGDELNVLVVERGTHDVASDAA